MTVVSNRLSQQMRLRKSFEFKEVKERGMRFRDNALWVQGYVDESTDHPKRMGLLPPKDWVGRFKETLPKGGSGTI